MRTRIYGYAVLFLLLAGLISGNGFAQTQGLHEYVIGQLSASAISQSGLLAMVVVLLELCLPRCHPCAEREGDGNSLAGVSGDANCRICIGRRSKISIRCYGPLGFPRIRLWCYLTIPQKILPCSAQIKHGRPSGRVPQYCRTCEKEDLIFVFIEGHGNYDGKIYKLNLVDQILRPKAAATLYSIPAQRFVIVNATSCSGGAWRHSRRKDTLSLQRQRAEWKEIKHTWDNTHRLL